MIYVPNFKLSNIQLEVWHIHHQGVHIDDLGVLLQATCFGGDVTNVGCSETDFIQLTSKYIVSCVFCKEDFFYRKISIICPKRCLKLLYFCGRESYFSYFGLAEAVLTSTHNLCFVQK